MTCPFPIGKLGPGVLGILRKNGPAPEGPFGGAAPSVAVGVSEVQHGLQADVGVASAPLLEVVVVFLWRNGENPLVGKKVKVLTSLGKMHQSFGGHLTTVCLPSAEGFHILPFMSVVGFRGCTQLSLYWVPALRKAHLNHGKLTSNGNPRVDV